MNSNRKIKMSTTKLTTTFIKINEWDYLCTNCIMAFDKAECSPPDCKYCPYCGAKVVSNE